MTTAPSMLATALWLGSWLRGAAASDDLLEALARAAPDAPAVAHIHAAPPAPLSDVLQTIRVSGADCTWLLLPRPGRTVGWPPGIPEAPSAAVLLSREDQGVGLLRHDASGWRWDAAGSAALAPLQAEMLTARSGARALVAAVTAGAQRLERLGVDRAASSVSAPRAWEVAMGRLPTTVDPQVQALLMRLATLHDALDLALLDDGAAVTAGEARARSAEIRSVAGDVQDVMCGVINGLNPSVSAITDRARQRTAG